MQDGGVFIGFSLNRPAISEVGRPLCMWSLSLDWIVLAVLVFWAVGAYNRVMRLRSTCVQAFGSLDTYFMQTQGLLNEWNAVQARSAEPGGSAHKLAYEAWQQSLGAMGAALAGARARPLNASAVQALERAHDAQAAAWHALADMPCAPDGEATEAQPQVWRQRWQQQQGQIGLATAQFNTAVAHYNAAIAQFPARVLAWFFGFRPARTLALAFGPQLPDSVA